jgi:hypothetical protein
MADAGAEARLGILVDGPRVPNCGHVDNLIATNSLLETATATGHTETQITTAEITTAEITTAEITTNENTTAEIPPLRFRRRIQPREA